MAVTTLDYCLRRDKDKREAKLLPVEGEGEDRRQSPCRGGLTVLLDKGRRVELAAEFDKAVDMPQ